MKNISLTELLFPVKVRIEHSLEPIVRRFSWINPSASSVLNCFFMFLAGFSLFYDHLYPFVFLCLFLAYSFDILDGMLARMQHRQSQRGSFIDGSFDRLGEIGFFFAMFYSDLFPSSLVFLLCISAIFTNYLQISLTAQGIPYKRSVLEKTDRNIYFFFLFISLSFGLTKIQLSFILLTVLSLIANIQLMLRGFFPSMQDHNFSIPSNPDETTFDKDYTNDNNTPHYGGAT